MVKFFVSGALFVVSAGCGLATGPAIPNDRPPNGVVVAQGALNGLNGKTVSGAVSIYQLLESSTYVIRLEGLEAPDEVGLQLVAATTTDAGKYRVQLRANTGNQNYFTQIPGPLTWSSVTIRSPQVTPGLADYGKALLQPPSGQ